MKKISSEVKIITPEMAKAMLSSFRFHGQRNIAPTTVSNYANLMTIGKWQPMTMIRFAVKDGRRYLVDGQHRLSAIVKSGLQQVCEIHIVEVDSVIDYYRSIDIGRTRTAYDMVSVSNKLDALQPEYRRRLITASSIIHHKFKSYSRPDAWQLEAVASEYLDAMTLISENISFSGEVGKRIYTRNVLSVALVCAKHQPATAIEFFSSVQSGLFDSRHQPEKRLHDFLLTSVISGGERRGKNWLDFIFSTIYCWNASFTGKSVKRMISRPGASELPQIAGALAFYE